MRGLTLGSIIDRTIIFRADGNSIIGFGHIYRMIALMEIFNSLTCHIIFVSQSLPESIIVYLKKQGIQYRLLSDANFEVPDKQNDFGIAIDISLSGNEIVVLDGYHFGIEYQKSVKEVGCKLVYIDDLGGDQFVADAVINHAPSAVYKNNSFTRFYTGLDYAILRAPFLTPIVPRKVDDKIAYICMGGSDYFEYSLVLLDLINRKGGFDSINLIYTSNYSESLIEKLKSYNSIIPLNLYTNLDASSIVELLNESTHAFVSASTVLLECYARGLYCYTGYYSKNQNFIYSGFIKLKMACGLGDFSTLNFKRFKSALSETPCKLLKHLNSGDNIIKIFNDL